MLPNVLDIKNLDFFTIFRHFKALTYPISANIVSFFSVKAYINIISSRKYKVVPKIANLTSKRGKTLILRSLILILIRGLNINLTPNLIPNPISNLIPILIFTLIILRLILK